MYYVFKDFAGPIATVIAAIAAVSVTFYFNRHQTRIAEEQARIAREKLRYDLFDRRLAIFTAVFDFYNALVFGTPSEQREAKQRFFMAYQESEFLFKKDSGIVDILKTLSDKGTEVIGRNELKEAIEQDKALKLRLFNEKQDILLNVFPRELDRLRIAISEYLNFGSV